jgi:dGTP triphosphohydrolase
VYCGRWRDKWTGRSGNQFTPQHFLTDADGTKEDVSRTRVVADYIAGMTDRYAILVHKRIFAVDEDAI